LPLAANRVPVAALVPAVADHFNAPVTLEPVL
jgi:hypothetical protein